MDGIGFDRLARGFAARMPRRPLLGLAAGLVAGLTERSRPAAALDCVEGEYRCGSGAAATCCPFFQACCHATGQCCGPDQACYHGPNNTHVCQDACRLSEHRCGGDGACCPYFDGTCCGADGRTCCQAGASCVRQPGGGSVCAAPCPELFTRRCGGSGPCCPNERRCCGTVCCRSGATCSRSGLCARKRTRRRHPGR